MGYSRKRTRSGPSIMNYALPAFGMGLGVFGSLVIFLFIGGLLFVGGFVVVKKDKAKPKDQQNTLVRALGYFLMILGMAFGLGFGGGALLGEVAGEF